MCMYGGGMYVCGGGGGYEVGGGGRLVRWVMDRYTPHGHLTYFISFFELNYKLEPLFTYILKAPAADPGFCKGCYFCTVLGTFRSTRRDIFNKES